MKANAEEKPKPGPEKWVKIQKGWNVFRVILNIIILGGLITIIVGNNLNGEMAVLQWYLLGFIAMYPLLILFDAVNDSRAAFLDGKWEIKNGEEKIAPKKFAPNWIRILPEPLVLGIVVAFPIFGVFFLFGTTINPIVGMVLGAIISFIPTFIITNFWLKRHLHEDLISFAAAVQNPKQEQPEPFLRYYFLEHFLPWAVILGIMNLGINIKSFLEKEIIYEGTVPSGTVPMGEVEWAVGITAFVLVIWMGLSAWTQVRQDVHLGRVGQGRPLSILVLIMLILLTTVAHWAVFAIPSALGLITEMTPIQATIAVIVTAITAGGIGRGLGIWFGKTLEFKKLQEN